MIRGEIKDDPGAERDRKPRQQAAGADFDGGPFAEPRGDGEFGVRPSRTPRLARSPDRPGTYARPRAASRVTLVRHCAPPKSEMPCAPTNSVTCYTTPERRGE